MNCDENDILLHVGPRALGAGRVYQQQRRVLRYENGGDSISTRVLGNERRPYTQDIDITRSATGKAAIRSDCNRPVGEGCKHVDAALLEDLARKSAPELPAQLASWLSALEVARQRGSEEYPKEQHQRIVYVFAPQARHDGAPNLAMTEADLDKLFAPS